jgi:gamma-glutamyltranspeptidase/glutathione hydrolase
MWPVRTRVAVAAPNPAATDAAVRVAEAGGGAVDAAVAAILVAMVTEPGIVSLGGGAYVTVWPAGGEPVTVDGYVAMPGLGRAGDAPPPSARDISTDYGGGVTMTAGHASVATPGALAGLDLTQARYGSLPWREVVSPAQQLARDGFTLGSAAGYYLAYVRDSLLGWDPETAAALRRADGSPIETGELMVVPNLAETLRQVAEQGARCVYEGELAERLVLDMTERGGLVTRDDLRQYRPDVRPALDVRAGPWSLRTNPPPAIGGTVLAAMLSLLGERPRGEWTVDDVAHLVQVQRRVLGVRRDRLDVDPDRVAAAHDLLRAAGWRSSRSASTAHVSVVGSDGTACAITASHGYGSGVTVPGTGLWLNNCLGELELNRGAPLAPGERLRSNMAPTVGRADDGSVLAIGSPGADRITTALLQVLAPFAHGDASLQDAVDRPRLHVHHTDEGEVRVEAEEDLPVAPGNVPVRRHHAHSMYFGGVGAALLDGVGRLEAAGDPRRAGAVAVSP